MSNYIGITRNVDALGRITIPKDFRKYFHMAENQLVEILATTDGILIRVPTQAVAESSQDVPSHT